MKRATILLQQGFVRRVHGLAGSMLFLRRRDTLLSVFCAAFFCFFIFYLYFLEKILKKKKGFSVFGRIIEVIGEKYDGRSYQQ